MVFSLGVFGSWLSPEAYTYGEETFIILASLLSSQSGAAESNTITTTQLNTILRNSVTNQLTIS